LKSTKWCGAITKISALSDNSGETQKGSGCGQWRFHHFPAEPVIAAAWEVPEGCLLGIFNVERVSGLIDVPLPDGEYEDLLSGTIYPVQAGQAAVPNVAVILRYKTPVHPRWFYSTLMNLHIAPDSHG
jgi:hypothetical protein